MRNNETGEFELVVGNRQLLSGFFIVVLLFAVAFAMGYVVGQNSRLPKTAAEASPPTSSQTASADPRPQPASAPVQPPQETPSAPPDQQTETPAVREGTQPAQPQPTTQAAREPEPPRAAPPARESAPPPAPQPSGGLTEPAPGAYWQVIATANRESAQMIVQSLKDKGFPASMSPGPSNLTRVLVGPYNDNTSMGRAKTELESSGFNRLVTFKR